METRPRGFTTEILTAAEEIDADGCQWIEVMPLADKARNGRWLFTITAEDLDVLAEHIRANPERIPVDYDHSGAEGGSTAAAGWFTGEADVREVDGEPRLYARVEWTPQAQEDIRTKRYRFISPEWDMHDRDEKSGLLTRAKELIAATLTNRPFFRQLAPVAADETGEEPEEENHMDELRAALGLSEDATEEQILEAAQAARKASDELAEMTKRPPRRSKGGSTVNAAIAEALGLPADADEATIIANARRAASDQERLAAMEDEYGRASAEAATAKQLKARVEALEAERKLEKVDRLLEDGVRAGKVAPAEKVSLAKLFAANPAGLAELIEARPDGLFRLVPKGFGGDVEAGEDVVSVAEEFASEHADGVDADSARLHASAERLLREQGKHSYTDEEYVAALEQVQRSGLLARR